MNRYWYLLLVTFAVSLAWAAPSFSADKPVAGKKVIMRDPVNPVQRRFIFSTSDPNITFGSNGDTDTPTTNGASLLMFNPGTGECQCIVLAANLWTIGSFGNSYSYHDAAVAFTPVKKVVMKAGLLRILAKGPNLGGVSLNETSQDDIAVHYTSGNGNKLCAEFSGPSIIQDRPQAFIGRKALAPLSCAAEPAGCTPCVPPIVP